MLNKRGFTLIELLIVITIIAVLSTIGIIVYTSVTMKARDARRKLDLQNIAQALEVYYQKNGRYPASFVYSTSTNWITDNNSSPRIPFNENYMSSVPQDPKSDGGEPWNGQFGYTYSAYSASDSPDVCGTIPPGQWYALVALLENHEDPDNLAHKNYKWCNGASLRDWAWNSDVYVLTPK